MNKKAKYKTMLCKNFESPSGCSYNEKCQFAHGVTELKSFGSMQDPMMFNNNMGGFGFNNQPVEQVALKKLPNPQNYKIVKCKNYEMGNCKYKALCTFAHGEAELRTKNENSFLTTTPNEGLNQNFGGSNQQNMQGNFMPMFNPYMPMQDMSGFPGYFNNQTAPGQDFNQMYNFQNMPPYFMQGGENMMVNPSNINLNMGMEQGSMDPNMISYLQQQQGNRNTQN